MSPPSADAGSGSRSFQRFGLRDAALPLNKETRHMVGERQLALMKKTAYLVNLARGGVVKESSLLG